MLVAGGSTNVTTYFNLRLSADGTAATGLTITDFDLQYTRSGVAPSVKQDATALGATDSAHADNKAIEIDATDQPGLYRVDWPDVAFAAGVSEVVLTVKVATVYIEHLHVEIDANVTAEALGTQAINDIWDEVITGGAHNVTNSAAKRLRLLAEAGVYEGGAVWIDTNNGVAGTTIFENGTVINPVASIADAKTIADNASLKLKRFALIDGSSITLAATFSGYSFIGEVWTLALGGQAVDDAFFEGCKVTGTFSGTPRFKDCEIGAAGITGPSAIMGDVGLAGDITVNGIGDWFLHHCHSGIAGTATPAFDFGAAVGTTNLNMRAYSGGIEIKNMGQAATDNMSLEGDGQLIVNVNSTGGTIALRGNFSVTNNGSATIVLDDDTTNINAILVDTENLQSRLPTSLVNSRMDSTIDAIGMESGAVDQILDETYEGTTTLREFLRLAAGALFGVLSGGGTTTITIRNEADDADRIVATVDADGNRSSITLTKS